MDFMEECSLPCCICAFCYKCNGTGESGGIMLDSLYGLMGKIKDGYRYNDVEYMKKIMKVIYGFDYDEYIKIIGIDKMGNTAAYWDGYEDAIRVITGHTKMKFPIGYKDIKMAMEE